jgi:hypothetical protein
VAAKEAAMDCATPAPCGYKADGSARKRPAPSPEQIAAANAGRKRAAAARRQTSSRTVGAPPTNGDPIAGAIAELDRRISAPSVPSVPPGRWRPLRAHATARNRRAPRLGGRDRHRSN